MAMAALRSDFDFSCHAWNTNQGVLFLFSQKSLKSPLK